MFEQPQKNISEQMQTDRIQRITIRQRALLAFQGKSQQQKTCILICKYLNMFLITAGSSLGRKKCPDLRAKPLLHLLSKQVCT